MNYEIISSGSAGNCVIINNEIMVDCGVAFNKIKDHLYNVKFLLLTHIHSDHIKGSTLENIKKLFPRITIIGNHEVHQVFGVDIIANATFPVELGEYKFTPFECFHDVLTYGYVWKSDGKYIIYATDTASLENAPNLHYDYFFIESNHCEKKVDQILNQGNKFGYDAYAGAKRHLSTQQAKAFYYLHRRNRESEFIELHKSSRFY